ncbi:helix-turn-helix domain-containing protein [Streptoalloteichus hindustanus]|uniref:Helix-turn-helix domain-containing protein n=1 Tax=Streptoalloteichus hindustanus TaxID=2017 RepID=A0A1M5FPL5_STRHI|nr:helix-turn-helix transcriptional regulator [Streptoalloteichus hindustanus]SHF93122.1 Helix-turn-helix domain-containing protein [Streptoalloteichus hindustanus]
MTGQSEDGWESQVAEAVRTHLAVDLDELRLLAGLSYRELARRTGCARSTLHDALTGRRFPRLDTVLAIVRACGGDVAGWRARWTAATRRATATPPADRCAHLVNLLDSTQEQVLRAVAECLLGIPQEHVVRTVARWRHMAHVPGTRPRTSRQSTRPS